MKLPAAISRLGTIFGPVKLAVATAALATEPICAGWSLTRSVPPMVPERMLLETVSVADCPLVPVLSVPALILFKYGKPRGYLQDWLTFHMKPHVYCALEPDSEQRAEYIKVEEV